MMEDTETEYPSEQKLREDICQWWLEQPGNVRRVGGMVNGRRIAVEIDESCVNKRKPGPM